MKIRSTKMVRLIIGGVAGLAIAASASFSVAQEEEGRRRGRPGLRDGDRGGEGPAERGGLRGRRGAEGSEGRGGPGGPPGQGGPEMMMRLPVMAALDADKDGVISAKEIANAPAALKKLDKNNDGKIDQQEMRPTGRGGFAGRGPGGDGGRGLMQRGQGGPGERGFGQGDSKAMLERIMGRDKNGDGLLDADELPSQMARMIEMGDKDGDGKLSKKEVEKSIETRMGSMRRGGGRPGGDRNSDAPGGERPRRPPVE